MAFCFQATESAEQAFRRLLRERAQRARDRLDGRPGDPEIHEARRELKRLRAILDLVRPEWGAKHHRRWRRRIDRCSRVLAAARDARARIQSLSLIAGESRTTMSNRSWAGLSRRLRSESADRLRELHRRSGARAVRGWLRGLTKEFRTQRGSPPGWPRIDAGIRRSYRRGRRALRQVESNPSAANHHRWRRHAKRLAHQLALLRPTESPSLAGWAWGLDRLGERLGEHHDLFLLQEFVRDGRRDAMSGDDRDRLLRWIRHRRHEIAKDAATLGKRLFLLPSRAFAAAVHRHRVARGFGGAVRPGPVVGSEAEAGAGSGVVAEAGCLDLASDSWSGRSRPAVPSGADDLPQGDTAVGDRARPAKRVEELRVRRDPEQVEQGGREVARTDRA